MRNVFAFAALAVAISLTFVASVPAEAAVAVNHLIASLGSPDMQLAAASLFGVVPMSANERRKGRFLRDAGGHGAFTGKSPEEIAETLRKSIDAKHDDVMKKADDALTEAKRAGELSAETKGVVDQALTGINVLREQLAQVEQKMARKPDGEGGQVKSFGAQVAESDSFKNYVAGGASGSLRIALKAITAAQAGTAFSDRTGRVVDMAQRQLTIRDLLTVIPTSSGSVDYAAQVQRNNAAAPVAEGAQKPLSSYVWEQRSAAVRTIAHLAKITRQAMDDAQQLQGKVEAEMHYGLAIAEEAQLLNGDGTGQNLTGMIPAATAFAAPFVLAGATPIDNLRLAILQAELALYPTDGIVLNPIDWARIELTKDANGSYIFANPTQMAGPRLWARPVVSTTAMTADKFLTGAFKLQTLYDRMAPEVLIASENADDFEKNLYTMRCEERLALAIERPAALVYGDFGFNA